MLLDTGPLVAVLNRKDAWHERVVRAWPAVVDRCVTTEAVVTEATHLVGSARTRPLEFVLAAAVI